jgi:glycine/D-amino acid oxidase-like deaminating enzyme
VRALIVGGGCRGLALARTLASDGHAVRVATRREQARAAIEAAGAECWIGDPGVVGTLRYAVAALHGPRLGMMLDKTTDTTVRGVVYEATGSVRPEVLARGVEEVRRAHRTNEIPYALLEADPADRAAWLAAGLSAVDALLAARSG